ncbi:MAG: SHOCT domain-containing protein [Ruminococcus sp.]|nr:SHOCT domain-containing protein [Ruminococcus sp.]
MEKIICKAQIKARTSLFMKILLAAEVLLTLLWSFPKRSEHRYSSYYGDDYLYLTNLFGFSSPSTDLLGEYFIGIYVFAAILIITIALTVITKSSSEKCSLVLYSDKLEGNRKKAFSMKTLKLPIDKVDSIMLSEGLSDKIWSGKTVAVRSASGLVKFPWVQNADEFVSETLAKIEEHTEKNKADSKSLIDAVAQKSAGSENTSASSKLKELKELLDSGIISQEDFEQKKNELLSKM